MHLDSAGWWHFGGVCVGMCICAQVQQQGDLCLWMDLLLSFLLVCCCLEKGHGVLNPQFPGSTRVIGCQPLTFGHTCSTGSHLGETLWVLGWHWGPAGHLSLSRDILVVTMGWGSPQWQWAEACCWTSYRVRAGSTTERAPTPVSSAKAGSPDGASGTLTWQFSLCMPAFYHS